MYTAVHRTPTILLIFETQCIIVRLYRFCIANECTMYFGHSFVRFMVTGFLFCKPTAQFIS